MKSKKWIYKISTLLVTLFLCGCGSEEPFVQEASNQLYFVDKEVTQLVSEGYKVSGTTTEEQVAEYIQALEIEPVNEEYEKAKPTSVVINGFVIGKNGQVTLHFDSSYYEVTGVKEVLMRAAIVKTICQAEHIDAVEFYINGQPLIGSLGKPLGLMSEEDFIDNTGAQTNYYQYVYSTLYFANEAGDALVESNLKIPYDGTISTEQVIIEQLIMGPIEEGMKRTLPEKTKLLKVSTKEGICTIDFNEEFLKEVEGVLGEVSLYSVVNSLVELPHIYRVQFTVQGEVQKQFQNSIPLSGQFERKLELLERNN